MGTRKYGSSWERPAKAEGKRKSSGNRTRWAAEQTEGDRIGPEELERPWYRRENLKKIGSWTAAAVLVLGALALLFAFGPPGRYLKEKPQSGETQPNSTGPQTTQGPIVLDKETLDALDADALWRNPDRWEEAYPDLSCLDRQRMEKAVPWIQDDSRKEVLDHLAEEEWIRGEAAEKTLDLLQVDFNIQCQKKMHRYLRTMALSPEEMLEQLHFEHFTSQEIHFAMEESQPEVDWYCVMEQWMGETLEAGTYTPSDLETILSGSGFSQENRERWRKEHPACLPQQGR